MGAYAPVRARPCIEPYGSLAAFGTIGREHRNDRASWIRGVRIYDREVEFIPPRWFIVADLHTPMSRLRVLAIALLAILVVAACQGTPTETQTTSLDMASATSHVIRA
jgi:hypothetical protein